MSGASHEHDGTSLSRLAVFDPYPVLTVTIEDAEGHDEVHLHAGGQGLWVGRMAVSLGASVRLITATGGEAGDVVTYLTRGEGIEAVGVTTTGDSAVYVHDRRSGGREQLAEVEPPPLSRHELDGLYELALVEALDAEAFVLAGPRSASGVLSGTYRRLAADIAAVQPNLVADLAGDELLEALEAGVIRVLKVSDEELEHAGLADGRDRRQIIEAMARIRGRGAADVVVTRGAEPTLAMIGGAGMEVDAPRFTPRDRRGGGDAITATLAVALARGQDLRDALRLAEAAAALNVTRRGLASVEPDHAARLSERVRLCPVPLEGS
jgi:1-phosphofructokinase